MLASIRCCSVVSKSVLLIIESAIRPAVLSAVAALIYIALIVSIPIHDVLSEMVLLSFWNSSQTYLALSSMIFMFLSFSLWMSPIANLPSLCIAF